MNSFAKALLASSVLAFCVSPVLAQSQGDWTLGIGLATVEPKSDNGTLATLALDVDSDVSIILTAEYFIWDNIGLELLAATPFEHDFTLGGSATGSTEHLPPTLSLNYHFPTDGAWKPFVGAGVNYTTFSSEQVSVAGNLELESSWGLSVQAGLDYAFSDTGSVRFNLRWFDIDADATLDGVNIGTAEIDPFLFGISYVHKF